MNEHDLQSQMIFHLNKHVPGVLCMEYYNGATFRILGRMGAKFVGVFNKKNQVNRPNGMSDIIGWKLNPGTHPIPFTIEVKNPDTLWTMKTYASKEQKEMHEMLNGFGIKTKVCRSIKEAEEFVKSL